MWQKITEYDYSANLLDGLIVAKVTGYRKNQYGTGVFPASSEHAYKDGNLMWEAEIRGAVIKRLDWHKDRQSAMNACDRFLASKFYDKDK